MKAKRGRMASELMPLLRPSSSLEMTQLSEASLPAAGMVSTAATGRGLTALTGVFLAKNSQTSPS